jgi:hypothetical protein
MSLRMNPRGYQCSMVLVVAALGLALAQSALAARPFEVRDSIQIADFINAPLFSPDERYFIAITQRGVLPQGVTEATVWLFETAAVRRAVVDASPSAPVPLARISSAINTGAGSLGASGLVTKVSWTPDGRSVVFLGRSNDENRQLFRVSLHDRKVVGLSPPMQDVVDFVIDDRRIVYFAAPNASTQDLWNSVTPAFPDVVIGTGMSLTELLYPNVPRSARNLPTRFEVWSVEGTTAAPLKSELLDAPLNVIGSYHVSALTLSPNGRQLMTIVHADEVPERWERYEISGEPDTRTFIAHDASEDPQRDFGRALQYQVINLDKGERHPLLNAPLADWQRGGRDALQAVWSPDGRMWRSQEPICRWILAPITGYCCHAAPPLLIFKAESFGVSSITTEGTWRRFRP